MSNKVIVEEEREHSSDDDEGIKELGSRSNKGKGGKKSIKKNQTTKSSIEKVMQNVFHNNEIWCNVLKLGPLSEHFETGRRHPVPLGGILDALSDEQHDGTKNIVGHEGKRAFKWRRWNYGSELKIEQGEGGKKTLKKVIQPRAQLKKSCNGAVSAREVRETARVIRASRNWSG